MTDGDEGADPDLDGLPTEAIGDDGDLEAMETPDLLATINDADGEAVGAVGDAIPDLAAAVDLAVAALADPEARIVYAGAGTSGRLAAVDAAEWEPTFGVDRAAVLLAGGERAMTGAVAGAEDDAERARERVRAEVSGRDLLFGVSASGRTPFTVAAVEVAAERDCATAALACDPDAPLFESAEAAIALKTGAEVLAGSTRMKAGLATKAALTAFSTATMVRRGRVAGNLMAGLEPRNEKLRARAVRIVAARLDIDPEAARERLEAVGWDLDALL
jgi:N-acetylmuramic acid 6-phosphate etherase